jgi:outer membrane protein assembly factor BamB
MSASSRQQQSWTTRHYVGASDGLYAMRRADGTIRWRHEVGHRVWSSPTVRGDWIWFGSHSGRVEALRGGEMP